MITETIEASVDQEVNINEDIAHIYCAPCNGLTPEELDRHEPRVLKAVCGIVRAVSQPSTWEHCSRCASLITDHIVTFHPEWIIDDQT